MTAEPQPIRRYTVEEYLQLEANSPEEKYEYNDGIVVPMREVHAKGREGEVLAMAGGSHHHVLIGSNLVGELRNRLKGTGCRAYTDLRIRIPRKTLYTYPDGTIVCGEHQFDQHSSAGATLTNPRVIIEVLSPSTERFDRGDKFALYREIPSLAEYVLVSQLHPRVETFFRRDDGGWSFRSFDGLKAVLTLQAVKIGLPLTEIFSGVEFPPESAVPAIDPPAQ
jgi:Uma2 family endonuclease